MSRRTIRGQTYTVRLDLTKLAEITDRTKVMNRRTQRNLGESVVSAMKREIGAGRSPVKGVGKFVPYAKERNGKGYPDVSKVRKEFSGKKTRPVNLELSGEWLSLLTFNEVKGGISVGWFNPDARTKALIEAHNEGLNPNVPQRQVLPNGPDDDYIASIRRLIKKVVLSKISRIINS